MDSKMTETEAVMKTAGETITSTMIVVIGISMETVTVVKDFRAGVAVAARGSAISKIKLDTITTADSTVMAGVDASVEAQIATTDAAATVEALGWATITVATSSFNKLKKCVTKSLSATEVEAEAKSDIKHGY